MGCFVSLAVKATTGLIAAPAAALTPVPAPIATWPLALPAPAWPVVAVIWPIPPAVWPTVLVLIAVPVVTRAKPATRGAVALIKVWVAAAKAAWRPVAVVVIHVITTTSPAGST
jgi:hypothetical protein